MTNLDYLHIKKVLIASVIAVFVSASVTALAFYYSTTSTLMNMNNRLDQQESLIEKKVDQREFETFIHSCDKREAAIERKFESIDNKLDWLIKNR
jgi:hypothetical protein